MNLVEVMERADATERQVDWWARHGVLEADANPGSGYRRDYNEIDVNTIKVLARVSLVMRVWNGVESGGGFGLPIELAHEIAQCVRTGAGRWIVVGAEARSYRSPVLPANGGMFIAIDLDDILN